LAGSLFPFAALVAEAVDVAFRRTDFFLAAFVGSGNASIAVKRPGEALNVLTLGLWPALRAAV